jgi:hypothetical protein
MHFKTLLLAIMSFFLIAESSGAYELAFGNHVDYQAGASSANPWSVIAADFDGDGKPDLAVGHDGPTTVSILKNNGNGTFVAPASYGVGVGGPPRSVFAADFDGDGKADIAAANFYTNNVAILKNNGDGTFPSAVNYDVGTYPLDIFGADLDGDGKPDLAVANYGFATVSILKNNGDGTFAGAVNYGVGLRPRSVFSADFDGDGKLDLAVANDSSGTVSILKNNGDGTFASAVNYGVGLRPWSVYAADFDGDGKPDLAVANWIGGTVSILKNNGDGTFASAVDYAAGSGAASVFAADFDGDGKPDLAVTDANTNSISILKNNGNGTFATRVSYLVGSVPYHVFGADFNGDRKPDLAVANYGSNSISILANMSSGFVPPFDTASSVDTADVFYSKQADLDMDNHPDIVYTGSSSDSLYVIYGKADGTLEKPRAYFKIKKAALAVDYINGDTLLDIVARTTSQVYVLLNQGSRNFSLDSIPVSSTTYGRSPANSSFPSITTGYFNNDASKDVIVSPGTILYGNGSGGFPGTSTLPFAVDAVASADFNNDGSDDLVITFGDSARVLLNNGTGTMTQSSAVRIGYYPFDVSTVVTGADFNKDGKPDFAVVTGQSVPGSYDTSVVTIALGNGSGGIQTADSVRITGSAINLAVNDVNRDKNLDLTVVNARTRSLEIYYGDGFGTFPDSNSSYLGSGTQALLALVTTDLNRDGNPDYLCGGATAPVIIATNHIPAEPILPAEMVVTGYRGIDFSVTDPFQFSISKSLSTVAGSAYWQTDLNHDDIRDVRTFDYNLLNGEYKFVIQFPPYFPPGGGFLMDIRVDGSQQIRPFLNYALPTLLSASPQTTDSLVFYYTVEGTPSMNPPNGQRTQTTHQPAFLWGKLIDSADFTRYEIQLSPRFDMSSPLYDDSTLTRPQFVPSAPLDTGKVYYWRARSSMGTYGAPWSTWTRTMAANIGTGCCVGYMGNVNGVGIIDLSDLSYLVCYLTSGLSCPLSCQDAANVNGIGIVDLSDLSALVSYLTGGGYVPPPCP